MWALLGQAIPGFPLNHGVRGGPGTTGTGTAATVTAGTGTVGTENGPKRKSVVWVGVEPAQKVR